jgi:hypothetical protein
MKTKEDQQRDVEQFVEMMKAKAAENLVCIVLYGSAATAEYSAEYSDVNLLCVLNRLEADDLAAIAGAMQWWEKRGRAALVMTLEELTRSADVFAIEMLDIKARNKILHGTDVISGIEVPLSMHRVQVERELRTALIRLRQRYLSGARGRELAKLLVASSSTFNTLLRHALIVLGHQPPEGRKAVADAAAAVFGTDVSSIHTVLDIREGKTGESDIAVEEVFKGYLSSLAAITDKVDRQLSA